jgi:hypothetical protein
MRLRRRPVGSRTRPNFKHSTVGGRGLHGVVASEAPKQKLVGHGVFAI